MKQQGTAQSSKREGKTLTQSGNGPVRPLSGVRVLAVENFLAGPYASMLLADYGAEVIKIESPQGDYFRGYPPIYENEAGQQTAWRFLRVNRNKKSIVLDLKEPRGKELFLQLIDHSDVVLENFRPGAMERLGLGWEDLHTRNPRVILASLSGFGQPSVLPGPYWQRPGFDIVLQGMSALVWGPGKEGDPPYYLGFSLADQVTGIMTAFGVTLALQWRSLTGQGMHVDLAMYDSMVMLHELEIGYYGFFKELSGRGVGTIAPFNLFKAKDGWFALGVSGDVIWKRFCSAIGRDDLYSRPDMHDGISRARIQDTVLRPIIEEWAAQLTVDDVCQRFNDAGVPAGPVQSIPDLFACPHLHARNMLLDVHDPAAGKITMAGNPVKFSAVPEVDTQTAPQLGEHTDEILGGVLGLTQEEIETLRAAQVIGGKSPSVAG